MDSLTGDVEHDSLSVCLLPEVHLSYCNSWGQTMIVLFQRSVLKNLCSAFGDSIIFKVTGWTHNGERNKFCISASLLFFFLDLSVAMICVRSAHHFISTYMSPAIWRHLDLFIRLSLFDLVVLLLRAFRLKRIHETRLEICAFQTKSSEPDTSCNNTQ